MGPLERDFIRPGSGAPFPTRLDDQLSPRPIKASTAASKARVAEPLVWQTLHFRKRFTWTPLRGRVGYRNGDLMMKGEGSTPVILAPKEPAIDWSLYEAVEIRMSAAGGGEVKIRIGDYEVKQKLGPPNQYQVYRFEVQLDAPKGTRPLAVMPTDSLSDLVAIRSIKLIPRDRKLSAASRTAIDRQARRVQNARSTSSSRLRSRSDVIPPRNARLHFAIGITAKTRQ